MRSPVRIRVAAPDNPEVNPSGLWFFYSFFRPTVGTALSGVGRSCYSRFAPSSASLMQNPVRIPLSEIDKLACQANRDGIFRLLCEQEYPGSRHSRCGSVTFGGKQRTVLFSNTLTPLRYPRGTPSGALVFYRLRTTTEGIAKPKGVVWSCYSPSGAGFVQSTKPVRIPR